jgi:membrane-bound lytic murein transglycosylase B
MKSFLRFPVYLLVLGGLTQFVPTLRAAGPVSPEEQRKTELRNRLCKQKDLSCAYVDSVFADPRLKIYEPPNPTAPPPPPPAAPRERERNPYLTNRFGLLTPESLERCRSVIQAHALTFDAAYEIYGVPKEVICGHMRIETNFGMPTKLSPNPFGSLPAVNRLVTLYVRRPTQKQTASSFARRQTFALRELTDLLRAGENQGWDLFEIPGSPTGAIGLGQFEPSSFIVAVDGDSDGKIDLFDRDDAILSIAHYLVTRGFDRNPEHQKRAIYAYYGGHYKTDPNKFYMKAVLKYADGVRSYLQDHPVESELTFLPQLIAPQQIAIVVPDGAPALPRP